MLSSTSCSPATVVGVSLTASVVDDASMSITDGSNNSFSSGGLSPAVNGDSFYDELVIVEQETPPSTSSSSSSSTSSPPTAAKTIDAPQPQTADVEEMSTELIQEHSILKAKIEVVVNEEDKMAEEEQQQDRTATPAYPTKDTNGNFVVPIRLAVRTDPLPSPPVDKSGSGALTRTDSFVYQHYETPSCLSAIGNEGECSNGVEAHQRRSNSSLNLSHSMNTQPVRFSAAPIRAKIRQGLMKMLKRRSRSGDRMSTAVGEEVEGHPIITSFRRDHSAERSSSFAKKSADNGLKALKAVLSASSLHYLNSSSCCGSGKGAGAEIVGQKNSTFYQQSSSSSALAALSPTSDVGQYEELPRLDELGLNNDHKSCENCEASSSRHRLIKGQHSNINNEPLAFGSSFKAVGNRLFRRRSSGAINRTKGAISQPIITVMNTTTIAPEIPLPSPPHNCNKVSSCHDLAISPSSYENGLGDLYDPLISFVQMPSLHTTKLEHNRKDKSQTVLAANDSHYTVNTSNGSCCYATPFTGGLHQSRLQQRHSPAEVITNDQITAANDDNYNNNNNNKAVSFINKRNSLTIDIIDQDDDDAFHREFSMALSMLHSQSQDLEKVLLDSTDFPLESLLPSSKFYLSQMAPVKPPRTIPEVEESHTNSEERPVSNNIIGKKLLTPPHSSVQNKAAPLMIAQSLEQTILACEPALMTRLRLEAPFVTRLSAEGVISAEFSKAILQLPDRIATRMALLREITANSLSSSRTLNDDKLHALCSAFKRELGDGDSALLLTTVYGIFKLVNTLSDNYRGRLSNGKDSDNTAAMASLLFESEKSLLVEVLESSNGQFFQHSNGSPANGHANSNINTNNNRLLTFAPVVSSVDYNGSSMTTSSNEEGQLAKNKTSSKFFTERRRLRQLSQSVLHLGPKFGLSVCIVNFQSEFGDTGAVQLAQLAAAFNNIVELSLPNANIGPAGGVAIANLLTNDCCCIKRINLAANRLGNNGVKAFLCALEVNKSLRSLNLGANSFSGDACNLELTHAFSANGTLLELDLSYNDIGDGGASALGFALRNSGGLEKLRLRRCGLNNDSMAKVLAVLAESKCRLVDLDVGVNSLSPNCLSLIVNNLSRSRRAISCQLQSCGIRDMSAMTHDSLRYFRELDLSNSAIGDAGCALLTRALSTGNDTLVSLNLNSCDLTIRSGRELVAAVRISRTVLATIKLCHNFKLLSKCRPSSSSLSSVNQTAPTCGVYSLNSHYTEAIRVVEVENAVSGHKVKVYCTLPDANVLVVDTAPATQS